MNDYWTSAECAAYLKCKPVHFLQRIKPLPSFPKGKRYPTVRGWSRPQWKAAEVIAWREMYEQEAA